MFCHGYINEDRPDGTTVGPVGDFRVSDADRNEVIERLQRHTSEGRLTLDEFETRLAEVHEAKTGDALRHALRELPAGTAARGSRGFGGFGRGYRLRRWFPLPLAVLAVAIAVVVLAPAPLPLIPIAFWSVVAFSALRVRRRHARRWAGPARVHHR